MPVSVHTIYTFSGRGAWKRGSNCPTALRRQSLAMTSWFPQAIPGRERPFPGSLLRGFATSAAKPSSVGGLFAPPPPGAVGASVCDRLKPHLRRARSSISTRFTDTHSQSRLQAGAPSALLAKVCLFVPFGRFVGRSPFPLFRFRFSTPPSLFGRIIH